MARQKPASRADKPPSMVWTYPMQVTLHLLSTEFNLAGQNRADAFNTVFAKELAASGVVGGARPHVLYAQYYMRTKPDKAKCWLTICAEPTTQEEFDQREGLRGRIRQAMQNGSQAVQKGGQPKVSKATPRMVRVASSAPVHEETSVEVTFRQLPLTPPSKVARPAPVQRDAPSVASPPQKKRRVLPEQEAHQLATPVTPAVQQPEFAVSRARSKTTSALVPVINRSETLQQALLPSPTTVSRKFRKQSAISKPRTPTKKFEYWRNDGSKPRMSERRLEGLQQQVVPIPRDAAHPPATGLLFRYWVESDQPTHNSEEGFIARKYFQSNVVHFRPPKSSDVDLTDVFNHMDRKLKDTPFVSTCNRLVWSLRLALSEMRKGVRNGRITLIDPSKLDKRAVFWARPFHDELTQKMAPWSNGAQRYCGTYEFLVWGAIHKEAIVHTIKVKDLLRLSKTSPAIDHVLRADILSEKSALFRKESDFIRQKVPLNTFSVKAIAEIARFLGLDRTSPLDHISHIVADIVQGWHLQVVPRDQQEWRALATLFARNYLSTPAGLVQEQTVRMAFLDGVRFGQGQFNARHKPETVAAMTKRAKMVGLECPARIITDELDAIKVMAWSQEQRVGKLLKSRKEQLMLEEGFVESSEEEEDQEEEDDPMMLDDEPPTAGPSRPRLAPPQPNWSWTRQMIRQDEDDAHSDLGGAFEFDAAGRVV
ncbi:hypothetical protein CB0940_10470 [Cercospora beticola]|uniref:DUF7587 domain-containing protein n=1 Tax=Cercospora beticola TaxID=122368 RepID=A0A2G5HTS1_CERBT|nr:hypothetical protein CB0940_10470 [Cercospora beticola]PIA95931.1 hypothetical protein CB0940_10470 [Cercospora beticola]WPB07188.1 hypothetical protein RHO25_011849 [Cercospora beticola]CAK1367151.1 unnamed protein product [Cercospora beticola]